MKITIPTSSTSLKNVLAEDQYTSLRRTSRKSQKSSLRVQVEGGDLWWTNVDDEAVIGDCNSILSGDIEYINLDSAISIKDIKVVAAAGVTANLDIVN